MSSTILLLIFGLSVANCLPTTGPDYKEALRLSLLFYEAQRSGHLSQSRIPWRGDSAMHDNGINGEDLTGGYYDASDFVKFGFTMAFTTTILSWGVLSYKDAYEETGQYEVVLDAIKWAGDYFIKCHPSPNELYGQVGDFTMDHKFWGRPEELNMTRPAYKIDSDHPGSDLAGEMAAAMAAISLVFRDANASYSQEILRHAKEVFEFGAVHRGLYHETIPGAKMYYESTGYGDELTWAAVWLAKATSDPKYLENAEDFYDTFRLKERPNEFFYNKKLAGVQVLLAELTKKVDYLNSVEAFCEFSVLDQKRTPKGLIYIDKLGTLSHAANIAFLCLKAADLQIFEDKYVQFAKQQIDYILGATGRSYVVGFGTNYPLQPHHASSSCPNKPLPCGWKQYNSSGPNPQILYGALVSGPDENDYYEDRREEFLYNEVTLDYNAGFQSALASLIHYGKHDLNKI